ncbi:MAG: hypothetical protein PHQ09_03490 [Actinomycetota bacterium]|nr:hypothetical protein [Actinomycetota bacterium]
MNIFSLNWKMMRGVFKSFFLGVGLIAIIGVYNVHTCIIFESKYLESLFLLSFGHLGLDDIIIIMILLWITPQLFLIWILRDCISSELDASAAYIFTRTKKRSGWLLSKLLFLFIINLLYWLIQFTVLYLIGIITGFGFYNIQEGILLIFRQYVLMVLLSYFYILIVNILSLKSNVIIGFFTAVSINIISILISPFFYKYLEKGPVLIKLLPSSQAIVTWHDSITGFSNKLGLFEFRLSGFSIIYSLVYLIIFCLAFIIYGCYSIEHMDIV